MIRASETQIAAAADERGFTLVELLVVIAGGMVIFVALMAILDISVHQTTRVVSRVDATQEGRTAMNRLEQELSSTCVNGTEFGVQGSSTDNKLVFYSGYGGGPNVSANTHVVTYTPGSPYGTLTDDTYAPDGSLTASETLLSAASPRNDSSGNPLPIFTYYGYQIAKDGAVPYKDPGNNNYYMILDGNQTLPQGATGASGQPAGGTVPTNAPDPFSATPQLGANASNTVQVSINLVAYANRGNDVNPDVSNGSSSVVNSSGNSISDDISLRLTPVGNFATPGDTNPCQ